MIRKLFNNRAFIIGLAVCSGLLMIHSIAAPFMDEPDFGEVEAPPFDPEYEAPTELEIVAADAVTSGIDEGISEEDAVWRAEQSVLSGQLTWNSAPRRDPFSYGRAEPLRVREIGSGPTEPMADDIPRLNALVAGPHSVFAVLNDRIVREGDLLGGYQVTRIEPDGVRIASRWQSHWLSVSDMEIEIDSEVAEGTSHGPGDGPADAPVDELVGFTDGGAPGG